MSVANWWDDMSTSERNEWRMRMAAGPTAAQREAARKACDEVTARERAQAQERAQERGR